MVAACGLKSPTFDETGDIAAGVSYLQNRAVWLNLQHPPLLKELSGLLVWAAGARVPADVLVPGTERALGANLIRANGPDGTMWLARIPMILVSAMLAFVIFYWGREMLGERAALGALFLLALDPNMIAHGYLATTDAGFAAFTMLFLFTVWRRYHWAICGAAAGLVLATKFTAGLVIVVAVALMFADGRKWKEVARDLVLMGLVATVVVQLFYFSPDGLYLYTAGMQQVNRDHNPNYQVYLSGEFARSFPSYFAVVWALKEPIATLIACAFGLWMVVRAKDIQRRTKLFLLAPAAVLFGAYALWADDLGVRYILPVFPFAYLWGGAALARIPRAAAVLLAAWLLIAAAGIWPDHLSYFNEAACVLKEPPKIGLDGGSRCGVEWLDDSNIDWGQGYKQLKKWAEEHAGGRTVQLAGFGSFPASAYGFNVKEIGLGNLPSKAASGLWAVSAHFVARAPVEWLRTTPPTAIVGHSIYIYDLK
jgi:Dolichyl-phosphate-mannose-protein mannosyltransferase